MNFLITNKYLRVVGYKLCFFNFVLLAACGGGSIGTGSQDLSVAESVEINGVLRQKNEMPVVNAVVRHLASGSSTTTDAEGKFEIEVQKTQIVEDNLSLEVVSGEITDEVTVRNLPEEVREVEMELEVDQENSEIDFVEVNVTSDVAGTSEQASGDSPGLPGISPDDGQVPGAPPEDVTCDRSCGDGLCQSSDTAVCPLIACVDGSDSCVECHLPCVESVDSCPADCRDSNGGGVGGGGGQTEPGSGGEGGIPGVDCPDTCGNGSCDALVIDGICEDGVMCSTNCLESPESCPEDCEQPICEDKCGDGVCAEVVCLAAGCECSETFESCPQDCSAAVTPPIEEPLSSDD